MTTLETTAPGTRPHPPTPPAPQRRRQPRQDAGRRPFVPCERCRGRGTLHSTHEDADDQICDDCGGSGRAL